MPSKKLTVTALKEIKEGTSKGKNGEMFTWKLCEVTATDANGEPITDKLKTFSDLPKNQMIEVDVEKQEHPEYGTSYLLKKKSDRVSREEFDALVKRVEALEPSKEETKEADLDSIPF